MPRIDPADDDRPGRVSQTAPESKSLSSAVWGYLEEIPGFNEGLREAEADLAAGKGVPFRDRRHRSTDPQPPR